MKRALPLVFLLGIHAAMADDPGALVGAAVRSRPDYDGATRTRTELVPVLRYYGETWFARTTQGVLEAGLRQELAPDFWAGAQLAYESGRDEPHLGAGASAGLHLEWDRRFGRLPVTFLVRARQHLDAGRGGQADLRITAGVYSGGGLRAAVFTQATWGSEDAVRSLYGPPNSGLLFIGGGVQGALDLGRRWMAVGSVELRHLRDEAELSPLAQRASARYAAAGLAYRF